MERAPTLDKELSKEFGEHETWNSGGTAHILPKERANASFDVNRMMEAIYGGPDKVKKRRFIISPTVDLTYRKYDTSREDLLAQSIHDFIDIHKEFTLKGYRPTREEIGWMSECSVNSSPLMPCFGLFLPTIIGQGNDQQVMHWLPKALTFEIVGAYGQTELGHGSNVRGLRTIATYDKHTQEFIINTPTLQAMKWWNSTTGNVATHVALYANLILNEKEYGVHVFMVQLRDENHLPLPGIECGDTGRKMGDNSVDTGYIRFRNVRIPREHLLAKRQYVTPEGTYVKIKSAGGEGGEKLHYLTMMQARSGMVNLSAGKLSIACTIATRYSCVRHQGFIDTKENKSFKSKENAIIDYQVQRYRVFKQLALAYAMRMSARWMTTLAENLTTAGSGEGDIVSALPEIHASSAGLKGLCTKLCADGMEDLRKCCGGHGYLLNSGIAQLCMDFVWQVTAEGDWVVMLLQCARYLMKSFDAAKRGEKLSGLTQCLEPLKDPKFNPTRDAKPRTPTTIEEACDLNYLLNLYKYRTLVSVQRTGDKLHSLMRSGKTFDEAWNLSALALKTTATIHVYYFMLRNFIDVCNHQVADEHCALAMRKLCALFACSNILEGEQWVGLLDGNEYELIQNATTYLLESLRPDAVALVDAFDIPDRVLNSTIGRYDGNVYEHLYEAARESSMNLSYPFKGFDKVLKPHLNQEYLSLRGKVDPDLKEMLADVISGDNTSKL